MDSQKENSGGMVDTSVPFQSVMEAVTRFGGVGFWKPHAQTNNQQVGKERETIEQVLKEIEATKTQFQELKLKLQKEEARLNTHPSHHPINNGDIDDDDDDVDLSKPNILKGVDEATEEAKQASGRHNSDPLDMNEHCKGPTMSIGQILSSKLALAEKHSEKSCVRWKVSLAQILSNGQKQSSRGEKGVRAKRTKLGFGGMTYLVAKTKKKPS